MKDFFGSRFFKVLIAIILILLALMLYAIFGGGNNFLNNLTATITTPIQDTSGKLISTTVSFFDRFSTFPKIASENEELRKRIQRLESEAAKYEYYIKENGELRQLLEFKNKKPELAMVEANVVSKDPSDWFSVLTLNKGSFSGISSGCAVITETGLVGVVTDVGVNNCKVKTILDSNCVAGALIVRTGDSLVISGEFSLAQKGLTRLSYIDNKINITSGDVIETSGLGKIFPSGVRIGSVVDVISESDGMSKYATIRPSVDFTRLRKVYVITSLEKK